ncbi:MAG: AAA family ATPase [Deltaproteobacteria bacterium]|nr:AAA family ATPase [Deltaproteobacteria bacterium]
MSERLVRVVIEGFKSIRAADLELRALNVLIGANGAGKSNLLGAFKLLNALTANRLAAHVAESGGAANVLRFGPKVTPQILLGLDFESDMGRNSYEARLSWVAPDRFIFADERVRFLRTGHALAADESLGGGHAESRLYAEDLGPKARGVASFVRYRMQRWRAYHFHDTSAESPMKRAAELVDDRFLRGDGGNIAAFVRMLKLAHPAHYSRVRAAVQRAFPAFDDFVAEPSRSGPGSILLTWRELGQPHELGPHQLSDGTLRFICLAALLLQPWDHENAPSCITIDEPELGLHPAAIGLLAELVRDAARQVQVVVSTQSPGLISALDDPEAVVVVDRDPGTRESTFARQSRPRLDAWLAEYTLGEAWEKGVLGGRP